MCDGWRRLIASALHHEWQQEVMNVLIYGGRGNESAGYLSLFVLYFHSALLWLYSSSSSSSPSFGCDIFFGVTPVLVWRQPGGGGHAVAAVSAAGNVPIHSFILYMTQIWQVKLHPCECMLLYLLIYWYKMNVDIQFICYRSNYSAFLQSTTHSLSFPQHILHTHNTWNVVFGLRTHWHADWMSWKLNHQSSKQRRSLSPSTYTAKQVFMVCIIPLLFLHTVVDFSLCARFSQKGENQFAVWMFFFKKTLRSYDIVIFFVRIFTNLLSLN